MGIGSLLAGLSNLVSILDKNALCQIACGLGLIFKQGIGQLEVLVFVGPGIKQHPGAGAETFDPTDIMFAKPASLVQPARVSEHMSPACSIDVKVNCLLADRALRGKRVRSPPHQQLYELHGPYRYVSHGERRNPFLAVANASIRPKL